MKAINLNVSLVLAAILFSPVLRADDLEGSKSVVPSSPYEEQAMAAAINSLKAQSVDGSWTPRNEDWSNGIKLTWTQPDQATATVDGNPGISLEVECKTTYSEPNENSYSRQDSRDAGLFSDYRMERIRSLRECTSKTNSPQIIVTPELQKQIKEIRSLELSIRHTEAYK